ncbi:CBS domain-containing protein [Salipaludibacillus keqinensis]|jgi:CBS domain-containing protein|uniref:CBS domain-containing protein n=1 Tax=Salipaludibacillus keqinensis TaxID=2045207 RepID=A0A323TDU3_9BACI|nr:CBS domain-containing protein [Salipaludibacillus keqinensis]PYZ93268.1 CBS domain-containing protein [Salipaludibacillus keqinensis]
MTTLKDIMTETVDTCSPVDNVYEAAVKMKEQNVGAIPICQERQLLGMITDRDIVVRGVAEKRPNSSSLEELMSDHLFTATPDMEVGEAAKLMAENQIRRLPVVEGNQLVGIVSLGDLAIHTSTEHNAAIALTEISERPEYHH